VLPRCGKEKDNVEKYTQQLCQEIRDREQEIRVSLQKGVDTLYFGGGTPSVLPVESFKAIMGVLSDIGIKAPFSEFTIEVNPDDITEKGPEFVKELKTLGVNRISMGVQSFDDNMLKWMNRRHSSDGAVKAYTILRECCIENISIDLIFGISHLDENLWKETIKKALSLKPEHISAYQLSIEEGSVLNKLVQNGQYQEADDILCERQYNILCQMLKENGYLHYEVSNFSLDGKQAKHNSAYWRRIPYVGLGPGAHSFDGKNRSWNNELLTDWSCEKEILTDEDETVETIMLALRTAEGINKSYLHDHCDNDIIEKMLEEGKLIFTGEDNIRIPEDRFFISDSIIRDLI